MSNISDINQTILSSDYSTISTNNNNISLEKDDIYRDIDNMDNNFERTEEKEKLYEYYENFYN